MQWWWQRYHRNSFYFLLILIIMILNACHFGESSHQKEDNYEIKEAFESPQELFIPPVIWDLLEGKKTINSNGKIEAHTLEGRRFEENVFVGLTVRLKEKTPGVLGGKNYEFKSHQSGGLFIDFANYIKEPKGTFFISFEPSFTLDPVTAQVLFLSDSMARKNSQGQAMGGGCGRFYDITKMYLKKFRETGVEVNVTEGRHVSFLAGTFFIRVSQQVGVRALTHLTLTDSNYPELLCDRAGQDQ